MITIGTPNTRDTVTVDLGAERRIQRIALYVLDDGPTGEVRAPVSFELQVWRAGRWVNVQAQRRDPARPAGRRANQVSFRPVSTSRIRIILAAELARRSIVSIEQI